MNGMDKANLVATTATLAALVFPVIPSAGSVVLHFLLCISIGGLLTFLLVTEQPIRTLVSNAFRLTMQKVWLGFCQIIHFSAIALNEIDQVLCKFK